MISVHAELFALLSEVLYSDLQAKKITSWDFMI